MLDSPISVSLPPDRLGVAARVPGEVELKFSWDHRDLLVGERDLRAHLDAADLAPRRVTSVHLPPGTETRGDDVGMALTQANRGTIVDFTYGQLSGLPTATLVAHPPKSVGYAEAIPLLSSLLDATDRRISVENTAVESAWYTPEDLGFVAWATSQYRPLSDLRLTVDSAHFPQDGLHRGLDPERIEEIRDRFGAGVPAVVRPFEEALESRLADDWPPDENEGRYLPLSKSLRLAGRAVESVHLNDPATDGVPEFDPHDSVLDRVLAMLPEIGAQVVVEPSDDLLADPDELRRRVTALRDRMADTA